MADPGFMFLLIPEHKCIVTQLRPDPVSRGRLPPSRSSGPQGSPRGGGVGRKEVLEGGPSRSQVPWPAEAEQQEWVDKLAI